MECKAVDIYNVKEVVERLTNGKFTTYFDVEEYAVILRRFKAMESWVITDKEAIHNLFRVGEDFRTYWMDSASELWTTDMDVRNNYKASISVRLKPKSTNGIPFFTNWTISLTIPEIESGAHRTEPLNMFVRTFGSRIESNYYGLLKSIDIIGLNRSDYERGDREERLKLGDKTKTIGI